MREPPNPPVSSLGHACRPGGQTGVALGEERLGGGVAETSDYVPLWVVLWHGIGGSLAHPKIGRYPPLHMAMPPHMRSFRHISGRDGHGDEVTKQLGGSQWQWPQAAMANIRASLLSRIRKRGSEGASREQRTAQLSEHCCVMWVCLNPSCVCSCQMPAQGA